MQPAALVLVAFLSIVLTPHAPALAAAGSNSLSVGDWWSLDATSQRALTGTGKDRGGWTRDSEFAVNFSVKEVGMDSIVISYESHGSWRSTATETWVKPNGGSSTQGKISTVIDYTLDTTSYVVTDVSDKDYSGDVGHPAWFLINAASLKSGDTVLLPWGDEDVSWTVGGLRDVRIGSSEVSVWSVTYTGESTGYWRSGDTHSKGPETDTYLFDAAHGVVLGWSGSGSYSLDRTGGGWEETISFAGTPKDTNLQFSVAIALAIEPSSLSVTVDGAVYSGNQLPRTFKWDYGSTHTLRVDSTIDDGSGMRNVFLQWGDGSKQTTRTIVASQTSEYKAEFKTQYELTVVSDFGDPQGAGWYDAGSEATVSVDSPQSETGLMGSLGAKKVFEKWSGDLTSDSLTAKIKMDGPRTVEAKWTTDNSQAYVVLAAIAIVVIALVTAILLITRRRGQPRLTPAPVAGPILMRPPTTRAPPPTAYPRAEAGVKYCVHCGATIPSVVVYCTKCGRKQ